MMTLQDAPIGKRYRKRLTSVGLTSIDAIVAGLRTGATADAIGALSQSESKGLHKYWRLVDWLSDNGYDVDQYRHRVVCPDA